MPPGAHAAPRNARRSGTKPSDAARDGATARAGADTPHRFRADIQGLRALAVSLVIAFHLYPGVVPGGFVGVDVFFVISGFLITSGLVGRRYRATGRVGLLNFWGRRARRLMPAAVVVLVVTWIASRLILPVTQLPAAASQLRASALYFQNWILAHDAVIYATAGEAASPVQHFWSLSVEEQFYLIWPLLFVLAGVVVARRARAGWWTATALASAVIVASFIYSIHETNTNPAAAYFITTTRLWELAAGGLLALVVSRRADQDQGASFGVAGGIVLSVLGFALIIGSALGIHGTAHFPGWIAAFPVAGSALILGVRGTGPITWLLSLRPVVFLGDISYSLYLWHWPVVVLWLAYSGGTIGYLDGPGIIALSVLLAWLSKKYVEDGIRLWPVLVAHPGRSLATAVLAIIPTLLGTLYLQAQPSSFHPVLDAEHPGAAALAVPSRHVPAASLTPPLDEMSKDIPLVRASNGCELGITASTPHICTFGDTVHPVKTVALVGDSHAAQWSTALNTIAKANRWKLVVEVHASCPFSATTIIDPHTELELTGCDQWADAVMGDLIDHIKPQVVLVTEQPNKGTPQDHRSDARSDALIGQGMATYFTRLLSHGIKVIGLRETPTMPFSVPDCLAARTGSVTTCSAPAAQAIPAHTPLETARTIMGGKLELVDMNDLICAPKTCAPVVGNVIVYRDQQHIGVTYSRTLEPYLDQRLRATGAL